VHTGTRFWETSGFGVDFSLFKGASLRTDSLERMSRLISNQPRG